MKEFQTAGPRLPNPSESDLASFSSLQKWDAEVFGFPRPDAELRQTWSWLKSRRSAAADHHFGDCCSTLPCDGPVKTIHLHGCLKRPRRPHQRERPDVAHPCGVTQD